MPVLFPVSYICFEDIYDQIASHRTCWDLGSRYKAVETHTKTGTLDRSTSAVKSHWDSWQGIHAD